MENGSVADKNTSLEALFPHRRLSIAIIQVVAVILLLSALIYNAFLLIHFAANLGESVMRFLLAG